MRSRWQRFAVARRRSRGPLPFPGPRVAPHRPSRAEESRPRGGSGTRRSLRPLQGGRHRGGATRVCLPFTSPPPPRSRCSTAGDFTIRDLAVSADGLPSRPAPRAGHQAELFQVQGSLTAADVDVSRLAPDRRPEAGSTFARPGRLPRGWLGDPRRLGPARGGPSGFFPDLDIERFRHVAPAPHPARRMDASKQAGDAANWAPPP